MLSIRAGCSCEEDIENRPDNTIVSSKREQCQTTGSKTVLAERILRQAKTTIDMREKEKDHQIAVIARDCGC